MKAKTEDNRTRMKIKTRLQVNRSLLVASATGLLALAAILPAQADYSSTVASLNPVGYWRLNEPVSPTLNYALGTATNYGSLGAAANGTYYHSSTLQQPGVLTGDPCVKLDGTSQYIEVPYSPVLNTNGPFSVEFWANQTAVAAGAKSGVMSFNGNTGFLFYSDNNDFHWGFRVFYGTGRTYVKDTGPDNQPDTWYHVVGVFDGALVHIYVNGVENAAPQAIGGSGYVPNTTAPLRIGAGSPAGAASLFFPGWMDEVAVYPYALSSSQIAAHYTAATTNPAGYAALITGDKPTGYWRFNEPLLPPEPVPATIVVTNKGSWGASANGTFNSGGMSSGVPGVPYGGFETNNTACQFIGTSGSYIEIPAQSLVTDSWTVTCWAKRNGISEYWNMLFSNPADLGQPVAGPSHPVTGVGFGDGGNPAGTRNDLRMYWVGVDRNTGNYGATPNPALYMPDQQWTFVAMVVSPSKIVLYMNGQMATHTPATPYGAHDFSAVASFIGKKQKYNGWGSGGEVNGFRGTIDEVAVFDAALTDAQIRQIYAAAEVPPIILVQPQAPPPPVYEGMALSLSVVADVVSSATPLGYQWTKNGIPIPGQTATNCTVSSLVMNDSGSYAVVITNASGAVTSSIVALTVQAGPPIIAQPPQSQTRYLGGVATFSATVFGSMPLTFQWLRGTTVIPGATSSTLTIPELQPVDGETYTFRAINAYGTQHTNFTLTLVAATKVAAAVIDKAPLGYWRMDETSGTIAIDSWGLRHGTLTSGVAKNAPGPAPTAFQGFEPGNKAYTFNGSGGYVTLPAFGQFDGTMTIIAWIKPDAVQPDWAGLVYTRGGGGSTSGLSYTTGGQLGYTWNDAAASYNWQSGLFPTAGQWNFMALVVEPTQATIYLDNGTPPGIQSAVNALTHGSSTWSSVRLGADYPTGGRDFKGSMDDVAVYAYALSAAEIAAIHDAGVANVYTPTALSIVSQPQSQTVFAGSTATLSATVMGSQPIHYQWQKNGADIPGAIRTILSIPNVYYTETGTYILRATNITGATNSASAILTVVPTPLFANLTNNLVLHLKFDGNYLDSSGRNNHGTPIGTLPGPAFVPGKIGDNAVHVDSEVDTTDPNNLVCTNANYVTLNSPADLQFGAETNFTVAYWVKMPAGEIYTEFPVLCNSINGTYNPGLYFGTDWNSGGEGGGVAWWVSNPGKHVASSTVPGGPFLINDGNWHHIVVSFDRMGFAVTYLDGVAINSVSVAGTEDFDQPMQPWNIGQDATGIYPWSGVAGIKSEAIIDDMGIWRRALSPTEAQSIYIVGNTYGRSFDTYGPVTLTVKQSGSDIELIWQAGTLEAADEVNGTYLPVGGAVAPYYKVTPMAAKKFYRVKL
jgi:hypothetical protein